MKFGLNAPEVKWYPLAVDITRYAGEWVAVVVADDIYTAEDAAELVDVVTNRWSQLSIPRKHILSANDWFIQIMVQMCFMMENFTGDQWMKISQKPIRI